MSFEELRIEHYINSKRFLVQAPPTPLLVDAGTMEPPLPIIDPQTEESEEEDPTQLTLANTP
ncbi:UNVERIFIED_CONTAM: hypothetical protein NY603_41715, partial [Bacteroidetes bacterium 56_B9]